MNTITKVTPTTTTKKVTSNELETLLSKITLIKGMSVIASVLQLTEPKTTKKDRVTKEPFKGMVEKLSKVSIFLNTEYVKGVENQLEREQKSKEEYNKGINTMPIDKSDSENNFFGFFRGKGVIEYRPNTQIKPKTQFYLNGKKVEKSSLPDVLPIERKATNQGTDKEIFWRKLYVSNVIEITINGITYQKI